MALNLTSDDEMVEIEIELDEELEQFARGEAEKQGTTLDAIIIKALQQELDRIKKEAEDDLRGAEKYGEAAWQTRKEITAAIKSGKPVEEWPEETRKKFEDSIKAYNEYLEQESNNPDVVW